MSLARSQWQRQWQRQGSHEAAGAIKDRPEAERAEVHEQLGPVRARMGGVSAQLGGNERVGARARGDGENLLGRQRGEELPSTTGGARAALQGEAVQEDRWQRGVDAHRVLPRPGNTPSRASTGSSTVVAEGDPEARPGPARTSREVSKLLAQTRVKWSAWLADWRRSVSIWLTSCAGESWIRRWHTLTS